jgi:ABC-2 type transport system permease protein
MDVRKVAAVVRREFLERVRTRWFIISTVLGPIFLIGVTVLPAMLATRGGGARIAVVDEGSGGFAGRLLAQLGTGGQFSAMVVRATDAGEATTLDSLTREVQAKRLDGYLAVNPAAIESGEFEYRGRNVASIRDMASLQSSLRQAVTMERLTRHGIDPGVVQEAQQHIDLATTRITRQGATRESGEATFFLAYIVGLVLYMAIILYGMNVMRSVIEEKRTRIIEVLVSSLRPFELMIGKVLGVGGVGLFQMAIWGVSAALLVSYGSALFGLLHISPQQAAQAQVQMPAIGIGLVLLVLVYFLFGYLIYSALYAVVGASVNTEVEAQQAQMPVTMLLVVAIILVMPIINDPGGRMAVTMGLIPLFSPIVMPIRLTASEVPPSEVALSIAVLVASTVLVVWIAARIYRVGILMYGKRPNARELLRWARQS